MGALKLSTIALSSALLLCVGCKPQAASSPVGAKPQQTAPPLSPSQPQAVTTTAAAQTAPAHTAATQARNQQLIDSVEKAYASGVANYRSGKLTEAKTDFDHAVDLMLTSNLDLKGDPQLDDEFERIVDAVNTLEMEALKEGNGFAPNVEPSPADIANDVTFSVDPKFRAQVEAELATTQSDLPLIMNDYIASYISYFSNKGHGTLAHAYERAGRYKPMIQRILAEEGVPQDLIYQAVAESGFQPQAVNGHSGAGGMWQFMPSGSYGLVHNGWVDERFDPEKSTRAYAKYMKFLYNQLGDWYLAMAAYDWGAGNVQRAVQRTGYADFWELYRRNNLPGETKNYVPEILAAIIIDKNPKQYGFDNVSLDPPVVTDTVTTNYSVDLRLVSDIVEAPVQTLVGLNPSLLRMATPPDEGFDLHLPPGTKDLFERRIAEIPEDKRRYWRYHKVVEGDTLESIARGYHVSAADLAATNQLTVGDNVDDMEALVIPVAPVLTSASVRSTSYTVRRGDTLITVADRFGVPVEELRRWNHLRGTQLVPGHRISVVEPAHITRTATSASRRSITSMRSRHSSVPFEHSTRDKFRKSGVSSKHGSANTTARASNGPAHGSSHESSRRKESSNAKIAPKKKQQR
jgi:membrane-bound lytic murein transglycosylase D